MAVMMEVVVIVVIAISPILDLRLFQRQQCCESQKSQQASSLPTRVGEESGLHVERHR